MVFPMSKYLAKGSVPIREARVSLLWLEVPLGGALTALSSREAG